MPEKQYSNITDLKSFVEMCVNAGATAIQAKKESDGTWTATISFPDSP